MTTVTDYGKLAKDVEAAMLASPNTDNDPLTNAQKRGAKALGELSAFIQAEIDRVANGEESIQELPFEAISALFTTVAANAAMDSSDPRAAASFLIMHFVTNLTEFVDAALSNGGATYKPGDRVTANSRYGASVKIDRGTKQ